VLAGVGVGTTQALQADDNSFYSVSAQTFAKSADYFGSIPGLPASPASLKAVWTAKATVSCTATTYAWQWSTNSWTQIDQRALGVTESTVTTTLPSPLSSYVSGGIARLRLSCARPTIGQFTVNTDVLRIDYS
jgi:hypothetical protein